MSRVELMIVLALAFLLGLAGAVWMWGPLGLFGGCGVLVLVSMFVKIKEGSRG